MSILVVNAGSSSLKFALFDASAQRDLASGSIDWTNNAGRAEATNHRDAVAHAVRMLTDSRTFDGNPPGPIQAVGQRVVHGGTVFRDSVQLDGRIRAKIEKLSELAPLHNPPALEAMAGVEAALPGVPQVAVFDTAFFTDLPPAAFVYPLPYEWYSEWGIRRFGFHGISHCLLRGPGSGSFWAARSRICGS